MKRRDFNRQLASGALGIVVTPPAAELLKSLPKSLAASQPDAMPFGQQDTMMKTMSEFIDALAQGDPRAREAIAPTKPRHIAMVAYPGMYPLDLLGPHTIFSDLLNTHVHLVWKSAGTVPAGRGIQLSTIPFEEVPAELDVLFVPGGTVGTMAAMRDAELISFLRARAPSTRYLTSVCTGSLILGAAGLLDGYRATSHWLTHDLLREFGATPVKKRVVEDRNRITGAGVTAGLDFALLVTARLAGENYAKAEQLNTEYDPAPPFNAGTPKGAGPVVYGALSRMYSSALAGFRSTAAAVRNSTG